MNLARLYKMTKRSLAFNFRLTILFLTLIYIIGWKTSLIDTTQERIYYTTFKDLLPILLGVAAAWLAFCTQRHSAYQQQLRSLWTKLIDAVQNAAQYTHLTHPTQDDYSSTLLKLSIAIDEIRGVFTNLEEGDSQVGLFPFEPIKDIYGLVASLKFGSDFQKGEAELTRKRIFALWKDARKEILKEFERDKPTFPHSHWIDAEKGHVYAKHSIPQNMANG